VTVGAGGGVTSYWNEHVLDQGEVVVPSLTFTRQEYVFPLVRAVVGTFALARSREAYVLADTSVTAVGSEVGHTSNVNV
jgi:hypothetical protein